MILVLVVQTLSLALALTGFGSLGAFFPVLPLGMLVGALTGAGADWFFSMPMASVSRFALLGLSGVFGAVWGAPVTGAVIVSEVTGRWELLLPGFAVAWCAVQVRRLLKVQSLPNLDVAARGLQVKNGRSSGILDALSVREAMVSDFEAIHEQEPISELRGRLLKSRYPFFPVVGNGGTYVGLLTADLVQESWDRHAGGATASGGADAEDPAGARRRPSPRLASPRPA